VVQARALNPLSRHRHRTPSEKRPGSM